MQFPEILLIDKPAGMSSFGVVARVRRKLGDLQTQADSQKVQAFQVKAQGFSDKAQASSDKAQTYSSQAQAELKPQAQPPRRKRIKVGHTGTLDPFATGLLILLVGKGTKRSNEFLKLDKWYEATVRLGATSTTGDPEGEITEQTVETPPTREQVTQALGQFTGEIMQKVPAYSAVKIDGRRAYQLARAGQTVDTPTRQVTIYQLDLLDYTWPELKIRCHVSSGTYIRTLGEDIGRALGTGAYLTALRRTQVGEYRVAEATKLEDFMLQ